MVNHLYDGLKREMGMIFLYCREWKTDEIFPLIVYMPGAMWHRQELYNDVPKYSHIAEQGNVVAHRVDILP